MPKAWKADDDDDDGGGGGGDDDIKQELFRVTVKGDLFL
jgi:hypothetical protein